MKNKKAIKERNRNMPTNYYPGKKMLEIPGLGTFPKLLLKMWDNQVDSTYKLSAITANFIYYVDENESDENSSTVLLDKNMLLVSDNYFAFSDLFALASGEGDEELLWASRSIEDWQWREFGIPKKRKQKK